MRTVCICASKKYKKEVSGFCSDLEKMGVVVFEPNINEPFPEDSFLHSKLITKTIFKGFTKADVCFIYNKDKYVGASVTLEIGYASALGKPIYALNLETGDPCRDSLIDKVASTPKALANFLK